LEKLHHFTHKGTVDDQLMALKSMGPINCMVTDIPLNMFFCVQQKKEIHTGLEQLKGVMN